MTSSNNNPKKDKSSKPSPMNSLTHLRIVAQSFVKENFPETKNGFEAFQKVQEIATKLTTEHSEEELLTAMFGLVGTSPAIAHFISTFDKDKTK